MMVQSGTVGKCLTSQNMKLDKLCISSQIMRKKFKNSNLQYLQISISGELVIFFIVKILRMISERKKSEEYLQNLGIGIISL